MNWESGVETYTLPRVKQIASEKLLDKPGSSARCSVMTQRSRMVGEREVEGRFKWGGDIYIFMADSCCCTAETNTTLPSNYPPIKNKFSKDILLPL